MLETADRPVSHDDSSAAPSGHSPVALNAINRWVPHNLVMRDSWFPVAHDYSVTGKPVRRAIYSHPIFLWRDNGVAVASEFHPNERIARDKSEFTNAQGRYPVMEHYGVVWIWFGNPLAADPRHLPSLPFLPPKGGLPRHMTATVRFVPTWVAS